MKQLECDRCGVEVKVTDDVASFICYYCVNELMEPVHTKQKTNKQLGYPKGWRFMKEFVHVDGSVYHKGVIQPSLKGTLAATPIIEKLKISKKERAEQKQTLIEEYASLKKKLKTEKRKTVRKKIELRLSKISKLI
jgi:hypothetical protein